MAVERGDRLPLGRTHRAGRHPGSGDLLDTGAAPARLVPDGAPERRRRAAAGRRRRGQAEHRADLAAGRPRRARPGHARAHHGALGGHRCHPWLRGHRARTGRLLHRGCRPAGGRAARRRVAPDRCATSAAAGVGGTAGGPGDQRRRDHPALPPRPNPWPYRSLDAGSATEPKAEHREVTLLPYFAWANRGEGAMRVWIPRADLPM